MVVEPRIPRIYPWGVSNDFCILEHLDGAELAAHGAHLFIVVLDAPFVDHFRIQGGLLHAFPVKFPAGLVHGRFTG